MKDKDGNNIVDVASVNGSIAKLMTPGPTEAFTWWQPYVWTSQTAGTGEWNGAPWMTPATTVAYQANADRGGALTNKGNGSYTYVFGTNIAAISVNGSPATFERGKKHRVAIRMGGSSGPTGDAAFDFVPNGAVVAASRNIITTEACQECHGATQFKAHGGDRMKVEDCATCHVPGSTDAQSGESLDLKVMVHKIHSGSELYRIPGLDGKVWDDPLTITNESADNGKYAIWGYQTNKYEWWKVGYPTKCHQGAGAEVDNWKNTPSRAACGSCHEKADFATGINHPGVQQLDDNICANCNQPDVNGLGHSVVNAHDFTTVDPAQPLYDVRNNPEFAINLTISTPANGTHFVAGESPIVYMALTDVTTGTLIDHTTFVEDSASEICTIVVRAARDKKFRAALLFVHGPRSANRPVLTTAARAAIVSATSGPWNLGVTASTFTVKLDGGADIVTYDSSGGDKLVLSQFALAATWGSFWPVTATAVTPTALMTWMNANSGFKSRAIAYLHGTKLGIRSRALGTVASLQLVSTTPASSITSIVFGNDTSVKLPTGSTMSNNISKRTSASNNDLKAAWATGYVKYTLDPVDDLKPGRYIANVEISDRGNTSDTDYKTPSVARVAFQVKTATEDKLISGNCSSCHQSGHGDPGEGEGFVVDARRHNKRLNMTAPDQCTACHDLQPQNATGVYWTGARPIAKRVHAIHNGSKLNYPLLSVDYSNGDTVKGRNWDIAFPQDVRNCEACHDKDLTSGSWATKPASIPCMGCHDSDAATAHMKAMIYDPTPADAYSGDEKESCVACH